jgi:Arc/MetJ-type ribon-helix-helix transcriptional regulator
MSRQIAVRLPDDIVEFIDHLVDHGRASSRTAVVTRAVDRERRRETAARDAAILAQSGADPEFDSLAEFSAPHAFGRPRLTRPLHVAQLDKARSVPRKCWSGQRTASIRWAW